MGQYNHTFYLWIALVMLMLIRHANAAEASQETLLCHGNIESIHFKGNQKTRDTLLHSTLAIKVGDSCSSEKIKQGEQALRNLNLFKSVRAVTDVSTNQHTQLTYHLEEKYYLFLLPRLDRSSDGEISIGVQLRIDNVRGLNETIKVTSEVGSEEGSSDITNYKHAFSYTLPRFSTRLGARIGAAFRKTEENLFNSGQEIGQADINSHTLSFTLFQWLTPRKQKVQANLSYSLLWEHETLELTDGSIGDFTGGDNIVTSIGYTFANIDIDLYRRRGYAYSAELTLGNEIYGSDFNYLQTDLVWRQYIPLDYFYIDNLNTRVILGHANGSAFGEQPYSIGSSNTMRGLDADTDHGFNRLLINIEWLSALKAYPKLRLAAFSDIGNVYRKHSFNLQDLEITFGLGIRWKLTSFVETDIKADIAYWAEENNTAFYLGTALLF